MAVKLKIGGKNHSLLWRFARFCLILCAIGLIVGGIVFVSYYHEYSGMVDERLAKGPLFAAVAQIYAAPQEVRPGQQLSATSIAAALRHAGYNNNAQLGSFQLRGDTILIKPGPQSYLATDGATITTTGSQVTSIVAKTVPRSRAISSSRNLSRRSPKTRTAPTPPRYL